MRVNSVSSYTLVKVVIQAAPELRSLPFEVGGTKICLVKGKEVFSKLYIFGIWIADLQLEMLNL